jgi:S-adenosylmethionine synthetase
VLGIPACSGNGECSKVSRANYLFTSESVSEGHPDKVCDQISDAILDAFLENDIRLGIADDSKANTRLGCETLATTNKIVIAGEGRGQAPLFNKFGSHAVVNRELISQIARNVVKEIGYNQEGFSYHGAEIEILLHGQSPDIAMGVDAKTKKDGDHEGAGDQGMMFGFACTESEVYEKNSFMPAPIFFAHRILKMLSEKRRSGQLFDLQPDAKSQVTVQYVKGQPIGCTKVVVSTQHNAQTRNGKKYTPGMVKELISDTVESALPEGWMPKKSSDFLVNPTGNFVVGGPDGDCGLTGRKIIVDTYGGYAPHGGGAFSGKPPMRRAIWPRMSWRRGWPSAAPSRSPTRSGWPTRCRCWSTPTEPARSTNPSCRRRCRKSFRCGRPTFAAPSS